MLVEGLFDYTRCTTHLCLGWCADGHTNGIEICLLAAFSKKGRGGIDRRVKATPALIPGSPAGHIVYSGKSSTKNVFVSLQEKNDPYRKKISALGVRDRVSAQTRYTYIKYPDDPVVRTHN